METMTRTWQSSVQLLPIANPDMTKGHWCIPWTQRPLQVFYIHTTLLHNTRKREGNTYKRIRWVISTYIHIMYHHTNMLTLVPYHLMDNHPPSIPILYMWTPSWGPITEENTWDTKRNIHMSQSDENRGNLAMLYCWSPREGGQYGSSYGQNNMGALHEEYCVISRKQKKSFFSSGTHYWTFLLRL
jgi:hypothetical protein